MFTKAGFCPRFRRVGIRAMVHKPTFRNWRPSQLVIFRAGDLAWYGGGYRFSWGSAAGFSIRSFINLDWHTFNPYRAWRCELDTRVEHGEPWEDVPSIARAARVRQRALEMR